MTRQVSKKEFSGAIRDKSMIEAKKCALSIYRKFYQGFYNRFVLLAICNGSMTEWSPIQSIIIRVITKSDDRAAIVRFVYHEYDYRLNWMIQSLITN